MNNNYSRLSKFTLIVLFSLLILNSFLYDKDNNESFKIEKAIDDLSIEELLNVEVRTASKKLEKSMDAPGIIEVITAQEIKAMGAITLFDILERASSIQPITSHLFVENIVNIRGDYLTHYNNHVSLLINGRPARELMTGGIDSPIYTAFPIDLINRIEIVRGPGSVLHGTNAFTGIINIITKSELRDSDLKISVGGGSFGALTGFLSTGITNSKLQAVIGAQFFKDEGWNYKAITVCPFPIAHFTPVDMNYGKRKIGIYSNLTFKNMYISAFYSNFYDDSLGNLPYATRISNNNGNRLFFDLGFSKDLIDDWTTNINFTLNYTDIVVMDGNTLYNPEYSSSWGYLGEISVNGRISEKLNIIFGGVIDVRKNILREYSTTQEKYSQIHMDAYTQLDYKLSKGLKLIAGVQLNKPDNGDFDFVPRLGFIYNMKKGLGFKALYGKAFRSAWPLEQMINIPVIKGNPDLKPEKIGTFDLQVSYQKYKSRISLTYFRSHITDIITRVPSLIPEEITYINKQELNIEGIELELKASPVKELFITGSAMYQKHKKNLTYIPNTMFKLGASYQTPFGLNVGLFFSHFGKPQKNNGIELNPVAEPVNLVSLNLGFKPSKKIPVEFNIYVKNLLDEDYYFPEYARGWVNTLPNGPGRSIYSRIIIHL